MKQKVEENLWKSEGKEEKNTNFALLRTYKLLIESTWIQVTI